jgi:hypothetical protein
MSELDPHPTARTQAVKPPHSLSHFIIGAIPITLGMLLVWWHLLAPIVNHEHQGVLLWMSGLLCSVSLTFWLWCVVRFVEARFAKRNEAADQRAAEAAVLASQRHEELLTLALEQHEELLALTDQRAREAAALATERHEELLALVGKHCRSVQALHKRLETMEGQLQDTNKALEATNKELAHLRKLIIDDAAIPSQRLGPRPVS